MIIHLGGKIIQYGKMILIPIKNGVIGNIHSRFDVRGNKLRHFLLRTPIHKMMPLGFQIGTYLIMNNHIAVIPNFNVTGAGCTEIYILVMPHCIILYPDRLRQRMQADKRKNE
ncbi:hypothetical protein D3C86_1716990 [compost metagenome]